MKRLILTCAIALTAGLSALAQDIPMDVYVLDKNDEIPDYAFATLQTRLEQVLTQDGIKAGKDFASFSLVAEPISVSKNIVTGLNNTIAVVVELNLFVNNNFTADRLFSSSINVKGSGKSEDKAIQKAFGSISPSDASVKAFVSDAKAKILKYYKENSSRLITEARTCAATRLYDKALCIIGSIPTVVDNYAEIQAVLLEIWGQYVDFDGRTNLQKARQIWNANQNREAAAEAGVFLSKIYPDAACYNEAMALADEIGKRIGEEWTFAKKMWQDGVDLESQRIEAARQVGVAYGNNQKPNTYVNPWSLK